MAANRVGVVTEEEKRVLLERYTDIVWLDDVTEVKCVRCDRVPIHHYVSNCLHLYCRNCRTVFSDGGKWRCPQCKEYVTELSDQHWELEDTIYQIRAHCPNKKYGCHYQGQLSTIPGHLRHCEDTREAALPAEFKGITLDTVANQITILKCIFEEMRSEMKDIKDICEGNCNRTEEMEKKLDGLMTNQLLKTDVNVPKEHLAHVEQLLKDVKELRDECEVNRENFKKTNDIVAVDIRLFRVDLHDQKEQLAIVKPVLKEVKELKDESEANWKHTETMVDGLTTNVQVLTQGLNEQKQQLATVEQNLQGLIEKESSGALEIGELRTQLQRQQKQMTQESNRLTTVNANIGEMQIAFKDLKVTWQTKWEDVNKHMDDLTMDLNGHKQHLVEVKEKASKDALKNQQQFEQQQTLIDTNKEQEAEQMTRLIVTMDGVQSAAKDLKENTETKWKETKSEMDELNKDLNGHKQQLAEVNDKASKDSLEIQQQFKQQQTLIDTNKAKEAEQITRLAVTMEAVQSAAKDLKQDCETKCKETKSQMDKFNEDLNGQRQQLAEVKDKGQLEIQQLTSQLQQQRTMIDTHTTQEAEQITSLNVTMGNVQSEVKDFKVKWETDWKDVNKHMDEVSQDIEERKQQLANLTTQLQNLTDKSDAIQKQTEKSLDELTTQSTEQKNQLANITQDIEDKYEIQQQYTKTMADGLTNNINAMQRNYNAHIQELRSQLEQQETSINTKMTQTTNQLRMNVDKTQTIVTELKDNWETKWKDMKKNMDEYTMDLNVHKQQLVEVKDKASKDSLEIQQQLKQQQTVIDTNKEQEAKQITRLAVTMEAVQSAAKDLKQDCETKWKDTMSQMDKFNKDVNGQRQQLVQVKDKASNDALEIQQLKSQLQQQHTLIGTNKEQLRSVESHFKDAMAERVARERQTQKMMFKLNVPVMPIGQSQMPHDALHSMTLLYQWHIMNVKIKDVKWNDWRESEVFALTGYDCRAIASIDRDGYIWLQLIDSKETKTPINTRSMPKLTWVIESQSQTTQDEQLTQQHSTHGIRTGNILFNESLDYGKVVYYCDISQFTGPPYVVSNRMKIKVYIEPPSMARSFFSNNGILLWQLDNYKERKQMEVDGLIDWHVSPYFYTSPQGYRVLITLRLSEKTVYGYLLFVKGEHDSSLTKLFPHRLTVTLFNHTDQSKNLVYSQEGNDLVYSTSFEFKTVSASLLESGGYVADDSLLIKAVVDHGIKEVVEPIKAVVEPLKKKSIFPWST